MRANGLEVTRYIVERLMRQYGLQGIWSGKEKITTKSYDDHKRADNLINRNLTAHYPNQI